MGPRVRGPLLEEEAETGFTSADIPSPVTNRQTNVIQAGSRDCGEIRFSDPLPFMNESTWNNRGEEKNNAITGRTALLQS